ncbi:MAG: hypothetical protein WAW35_09350 [Sideroxyarcus sp.]
MRKDSQFDILYVGRAPRQESVKALLSIDDNVDAGHNKKDKSGRIVFVSEMPFPGALCVPLSLRIIVPLAKPTNEIMAGFEGELRRRIRKNIAHAHMQQVLNDIDIDRAEKEMLRPFATARHGDSAHQIEPDEVRRIAQKAGRLDFVLLGDEVVACNLGCAFTRAGKGYWSTIRFGYPKEVFSNSKRLGETNAISFFLALEWAIKNGFDYYDLGTCFGRPEDTLLQWKNRWGGEISRMGYHDHVHVRLPSVGAAQFLWDAPLFSAEGKNLTLHLGLPDGPNDDEAAIRYQRMGFGGLFKIYLHCSRQPGDLLLEKLFRLCKHREYRPAVEIVLSA